MATLKRRNSKMDDFKDSRFFESFQKQDQTNNLQWTQIKAPSNLISKRAHHASAICKNKMYVYGGYEAGGIGILNDLICLNMETKQWTKIQQKNQKVGFRHSHSLVHWNNNIYLFGGIINTFESTNKLYSYKIETKQWKEQPCKGQVPPALNSHKAVVYNDQMIVFGGQQKAKYNQCAYSLNLSTNEWKIICQFTKQGVSPRSDFSMSLHNDKLYIFGGRNDDLKYNQLWQYNIATNHFKALQTSIYIKPTSRSGHASCIHKDHLIVFGGTTGVTHQRNDLIVYNIQKSYWLRHWQDEQSEKKQQKYTQIQGGVRMLTKSRSNSYYKKIGCSSFASSSNGANSKCNEKSQGENQKSKNTIHQSTKHKYREQMKKQNYYNQNYPFYGDKQCLLGNKHIKNDLLLDLQKETKQDFKNYQGLGTKNGKKVEIHLSQTFQSLNNSILTCFFQNGGKFDTGIANVVTQKNTKLNLAKRPKPRDGHTCQLFNDQMVIFGGDRHHMSYSDVILMDLGSIIGTCTKSKAEQIKIEKTWFY